MEFPYSAFPRIVYGEKILPQLSDAGKRERIRGVALRLRRIGMRLHENTVDAGRDGRSCEKRGESSVAARTCTKTAGTLDTGTVRFSFSPFNTEEQIDCAAEICKTILKKF